MADNQVLEEEYDPDYVPTQEEIDEYAEFIGMDLQNERDKELMWIAEEGLKAPLPSEWKPCKTDDDDIYYFNFDSGESRWEHPCDEYYKKLYKSEKEKQSKSHSKQSQNQLSKIMAPLKKVKSPKPKSSTKIEDNFDSMFQNEIDQILESDIVSTDKSASLSPKKKNESHQIAQKLQAELETLVPKTDSSNIPTFHLDLSTDLSQKDANDENMEKWKIRENDKNQEEKKLYLSKLQTELKKFKEESKQKQIAKIEKKIDSETKVFAERLQRAAKAKEIDLEQKYEDNLKELRASNDNKLSKSTDEFQSMLKKNKSEIERIDSKHREIVHKMENDQEAKVKELCIQHNLNNNQILKTQNCAIEKIKQNHEEYLADVQKSMELDIENLTQKQQSLQQQNDSLQSFKEKKLKMQNECDAELEQMKNEHEGKLNAAKVEWEQEFVDSRMKHQAELKEFVDCIEKSKVDCLSENEVADYKKKYALDIEQRKEKIKMAMHSEYENWKTQKTYLLCEEESKLDDCTKLMFYGTVGYLFFENATTFYFYTLAVLFFFYFLFNKKKKISGILQQMK